MTKILVTGAGGFAGHHFLEHVLATTDWDVTATDSFRHKGKTDRIREVLDGQPAIGCACSGACTETGGCPLAMPAWHSRVSVLTHDLTAPFSKQMVKQLEDTDAIVAFASESHVDRSITDPVPFIRNNTDVVLNTLELARKIRPRSFVLVSTDEVYGPVAASDLYGHREWAPILPSNPYSASKAAQEAIAISYWRTFGVPVQIVNCMNMIGERQDPEKFVPLVLRKVLKGKKVKIHGTPAHIGTRHYLHARNLADGITYLLDSNPAVFPAHVDAYTGKHKYCTEFSEPDRYNIASPDRIDNLEMAQMIAHFAGKELRYELQDFHGTRPGHDPHYGLNGAKMEATGWVQPVSLRDSLRKTVEWTMAHPEWLLDD